MVRTRTFVAVVLFGDLACAGGPGAGSAGESATSTSTSNASSTTSAPSTNTDGMSSTSAAPTTTDATSSASTSSASTAETGLFIESKQDLGDLECDSWLQDCPEGYKCNSWANDGGGTWNAWKCVPVDPRPDGPWEPCTVVGNGVSGLDSCDKGAMCWNVDPDTKIGLCVPLCQGDPELCTTDPGSCCPPVTHCAISAGGVLTLCLSGCNPLTQDCEHLEEACVPYEDTFVCWPDQSGAEGQVGDPCDADNGCDPGNYCGTPEDLPGCDPKAPGCCQPFCSLAAPDCPPETECLPWYEPMSLPPGFDDVGSCRIP